MLHGHFNLCVMYPCWADMTWVLDVSDMPILGVLDTYPTGVPNKKRGTWIPISLQLQLYISQFDFILHKYYNVIGKHTYFTSYVTYAPHFSFGHWKRLDKWHLDTYPHPTLMPESMWVCDIDFDSFYWDWRKKSYQCPFQLANVECTFCALSSNEFGDFHCFFCFLFFLFWNSIGGLFVVNLVGCFFGFCLLVFWLWWTSSPPFVIFLTFINNIHFVAVKKRKKEMDEKRYSW